MDSRRPANRLGRSQSPEPAALERSGTHNSDEADDGKTLRPVAVFPFGLRPGPSASIGLRGIGAVQDQHILVLMTILMGEWSFSFLELLQITARVISRRFYWFL
jgi:hypothetical protein